MATQTWSDVFELYRVKGELQYAGEPVTQLAHAWQAYMLAAEQGATPALQLAAFLHDLGHLFQKNPGSPTTWGLDDRHEAIGAAYLRPLASEEVCEPIALHVKAKRYLVVAEPDYAARLSEDSVRSLTLQGGPMSAKEADAFIQNPWAQDAIALRRWDEQAKDALHPTPRVDLALGAIQDLAASLFSREPLA